MLEQPVPQGLSQGGQHTPQYESCEHKPCLHSSPLTRYLFLICEAMALPEYIQHQTGHLLFQVKENELPQCNEGPQCGR